MQNKLLEILLKAFQKPKPKQKYLVVVREKCHFLEDEIGLVYIVESENKIKPGMHHSYHCKGLADIMSAEEQAICKKCKYKRVRIIEAVEPYSYAKAKSLKAEQETRTIRDVL